MARKRVRRRTTPHPLGLVVGVRVRALRREHDYATFIDATGLGRGYISELERGLIVPGLDALARLAKVLGVTVCDLVAGKSPRERLYEETRNLSARAIKQLRAQAAKLSR